MEFLAGNALGTLVLAVLFAALVMACALEVVNGFHDTAGEGPSFLLRRQEGSLDYAANGAAGSTQ